MRTRVIQHFIADLKPLVPYTGSWLVKFPTCVCSNLSSVFSSIKEVSLKGGGFALWQLLLSLVRFPVHFLLTSLSLCLNAIASLINNLFANNIERPLSDPEIQYLNRIFAANLDYAVIRLQMGGIKEHLHISPQAVGNDIFLRKVWGSPVVNNDGSLTHAGLCLLGHEACHVWQFQTNGAAYIGDSLITQALDFISRRFGLKLTDGYNAVAALNAGTTFAQCNVEQQAVLAETIGAACFVSGLDSPQKKELDRFFEMVLSDSQYQSVLHSHNILKGIG